MSDLTRHVAVITGASSGIGRATALAFADRGAQLVIAARRTEALDSLAAECRGRGVEVLVHPVDVSDENAVTELAATAIGRFGRVDTWVNNAAVTSYGRLEETPGSVWRGVVQTNVFGTYHGARAIIPWFREQGSGVVVNVGSVLSKSGAPQQSAYVASKYAVRAISDCLRQETQDVPGISVCTILPGPVDTPFFASGANYTGRTIVPPGAPVDARRVAAAIVRCATHPRREVALGSMSRVGLLGARLAPGLTERIAGRTMARSHFEDPPTSATAGNVFEPRMAEQRIDGGWRDLEGRRARGRRAGRWAVAAAAVAAAYAATRKAAQ